MIDMRGHQAQLVADGMTVLPPGIFPPAVIRNWRTFAFDHARPLGVNIQATASGWAYNRDGERHSYAMIDGTVVKARLPEMYSWYQALISLVSVLTFDDVVTSPYPLSDVNVLLYDRPADAIGWHYDTNPITFLVYLTDNEEGGTECRLLKRRHDDPVRLRVVQPRAGAVLLMRGTLVEHRGLPVTREKKACAVWNYYTSADTRRPVDYDDNIYGKAI
jgi:hypothetical protein